MHLSIVLGTIYFVVLVPSVYRRITFVYKRNHEQIPHWADIKFSFSLENPSAAPSTPKTSGGVLASNGKLYLVPDSADTVAEFDPFSRIYEQVAISSPISTSGAYKGAIEASNGKIYLVPHNANSVGEFDPLQRTFRGRDVSTTGLKKYYGGVRAPNGNLYFAPWDAGNIGEFNPSTNAFTPISIPISGTQKYSGGVLANDGLIYFVPYDASGIGRFNPVTANFVFIDISTGISGVAKYMGGVLAPNGNIYFVPSSANSIGEFNTSTSTFSTIDISGTIASSPEKYHGGVLTLDGNIYFVPYNANNIGKFSLGTKTFASIDLPPSGLKWRNIGATKPAQGRELLSTTYTQLVAALKSKVEFTGQEWAGFGITDLRIDDFIKSGDSYFAPDEPEKKFAGGGVGFEREHIFCSIPFQVHC